MDDPDDRDAVEAPRRTGTPVRPGELLLMIAGLLLFAGIVATELEGQAAVGTTREESLLDNRRVPPDEEAAFSFAVFGDIQDGVAYFPDVYRRAIEERGCELGVVVGDLVNEPTAANYRHLHRALAVEPARMPLLAVPGNHDAKDGGANFRRSIGTDRFAVVHRGCLLVGLDGSGREDPAAELAFLRRSLESAPGDVRRRFVFLHRPLDEEGTRDGHAVLRPRGRKLFDLARRHGVDVIFAGHRHGYTRRTVDGEPPVLVANGEGCDLDGGELWPSSVPWTLVRVDEGGVKTRLVREEPRHAPTRIARFLVVGAAHPFLAAHPEAAVALILLAAALAGLGLHRVRSRGDLRPDRATAARPARPFPVRSPGLASHRIVENPVRKPHTHAPRISVS